MNAAKISDISDRPFDTLSCMCQQRPKIAIKCVEFLCACWMFKKASTRCRIVFGKCNSANSRTFRRHREYMSFTLNSFLHSQSKNKSLYILKKRNEKITQRRQIYYDRSFGMCMWFPLFFNTMCADFWVLIRRSSSPENSLNIVISANKKCT